MNLINLNVLIKYFDIFYYFREAFDSSPININKVRVGVGVYFIDR